jgi:hypothetical protein
MLLVLLASMALAAGVGKVQADAASGGGLQPLPGLREEVVLQGAVLGDRRLDVNRFVDARPPAVLREAVRAYWARRPAPVHAMEHEGWLVLVQATGRSVETIETRPRGSGAEGRHTRLSRLESATVDASAWLEQALPAGSRVLRRITHQDGARRLTTLVALSDRPAANLSRVLHKTLARHGFRHQPRSMPSFGGATGSLQVLARGSEDLAMAISEQAGERAIVMHWGRAGS